MVDGRIYFSSRCQLVDDLRQVFSQELRGEIRVHSHLSCHRTNLIGTKRFLDLIAGNRLVFTHTNPGRECVALAALGKFAGQALQSPALSKETAESPQELIACARTVASSTDRAKYRI